MKTSSLLKIAAAAGLTCAAVAGATVWPSEVHAGEPAMSQGTPAFLTTPQPLSAVVHSQRWVEGDLRWSGFRSILLVQNGSLLPGVGFNTWNIVTCSGGATVISDPAVQPRFYPAVPPASPYAARENSSRCSSGQPAWIVGMIDIL